MIAIRQNGSAATSARRFHFCAMPRAASQIPPTARSGYGLAGGPGGAARRIEKFVPHVRGATFTG